MPSWHFSTPVPFVATAHCLWDWYAPFRTTRNAKWPVTKSALTILGDGLDDPTKQLVGIDDIQEMKGKEITG